MADQRDLEANPMFPVGMRFESREELQDYADQLERIQKLLEEKSEESED